MRLCDAPRSVGLLQSKLTGVFWPSETCRRRRLSRTSIHAPTSSWACFFVGQLGLPVIDKTLALKNSKEGFQAMVDGDPSGKIVFTLSNAHADRWILLGFYAGSVSTETCIEPARGGRAARHASDRRAHSHPFTPSPRGRRSPRPRPPRPGSTPRSSGRGTRSSTRRSCTGTGSATPQPSSTCRARTREGTTPRSRTSMSASPLWKRRSPTGSRPAAVAWRRCIGSCRRSRPRGTVLCGTGI